MYTATNLNFFGGKMYYFLGNIISLYTYNQHTL